MSKTAWIAVIAVAVIIGLQLFSGTSTYKGYAGSGGS